MLKVWLTEPYASLPNAIETSRMMMNDSLKFIRESNQ